jgi:Electron transfer DM13
MAVRRRTWIGSAAVVCVVAVAGVVLLWFQPQTLLYDERVDEPLPGTGASVELARGNFVSGQHETTGTARVLRLPDGEQVVRLEDFSTSNGPALYVYLSQNPAEGEDGSFDDDYVDLGPLKGNLGDQNYPVPAEINGVGYASVVVWCERFSVPFGAADLMSAGS